MLSKRASKVGGLLAVTTCVALAVSATAAMPRDAHRFSAGASPYEQTIAFSRGVDGQYADIYVAKGDGSALRQLTRGPGFKYDPDWSPDGRRLLYRWEPPQGRKMTFGGLVVTGADGGHAVDIAKRARLLAGPASWAPTGKWIALSGTDKPQRKPGIYVIRADGSSARRLTPLNREAQYPAWSPDGTRIAFAYVERSGFNLYVMNSDGSAGKQLTRGGQDNWPVWSPDSKRIAFNRGEATWIMDADGSGAHKLATTIDGGAPLNWAPKEWLIFACSRDSGVGVCAQAPDSRATTRLLGGQDAGFPAWRP